ncbi:DUF2243 domain-containing protein [Aeromicrobium sp. Marseille-Q0843]|uniref:DUF2243 domain-containing protein n=1 Tax=Aeromicrobium phoceense TaxID=2754045 RepID=A0A838XGF3_9ACTN|nr:DUF2243 domain-containing protein [Aeromicrobium phoceense]
MNDDIRTSRPAAPGRSVWGGVLIGLGLVAAIDEIVLHQLLRWHHFYDKSTTAAGLVSDGLLHAGSVVAMVAGFFVLVDQRRGRTLRPGAAWAGLLLGMGAFQLWDGLVNHKLLGLHQIRYGVEILPYAPPWRAIAVLLLAAGGLLLWRRRSRPRR